MGDLNINVLPQVTSAVHLKGGVGKATLTYSGSGAAYLRAGEDDSELDGGSGSNILEGGPGDDTLVLGSATNVVGGGAGNNTVVITTPMTQGGLIVGGTSAGNNTFVVLAGDGTQSISATPDADPSTVDLNYQITGQPPAPALVLGQFSTLVVSTQDRATNVTIGDFERRRRHTSFCERTDDRRHGTDGRSGCRAGAGPSNLSLLPFVHSYPDPQDTSQTIVNNAGAICQRHHGHVNVSDGHVRRRPNHDPSTWRDHLRRAIAARRRQRDLRQLDSSGRSKRNRHVQHFRPWRRETSSSLTTIRPAILWSMRSIIRRSRSTAWRRRTRLR